MKENSVEELRQELEELYKTQQARLDVGADDLDIREEIAEVEEQIKELQDETNKESREKELSEIERDLEVTMNNDFDELERIILNDIDLSDETVQWLYDILHKNMNLFFKHIMQRLKNKNYL